MTLQRPHFQTPLTPVALCMALCTILLFSICLMLWNTHRNQHKVLYIKPFLFLLLLMQLIWYSILARMFCIPAKNTHRHSLSHTHKHTQTCTHCNSSSENRRKVLLQQALMEQIGAGSVMSTSLPLPLRACIVPALTGQRHNHIATAFFCLLFSWQPFCLLSRL